MESFINPEEFVEVAEAEARRRSRGGAQRGSSLQSRSATSSGSYSRTRRCERWERECLAVVRTEAYYFLPQMQTKIMNEGWASYWHSRLMTENICDASEIVDYAERCASGAGDEQRASLNPYKLGDGALPPHRSSAGTRASSARSGRSARIPRSFAPQLGPPDRASAARRSSKSGRCTTT